MTSQPDLTPPEVPVALLASGGVDSCALLGLLIESGVAVIPIYVRAGHSWEKEEARALEHFLKAIGYTGKIETIALELGALCEAARGGYKPSYYEGYEANFLPGRNLVLLAAGAILANSVGASTLALGTLSGNPYPDAQPAFFEAFEQTAGLALESPIHVWAPLTGLDKPDLVRLARHLPLELSMSCVLPDGGLHCGDRCNKCAERQRGFALAGVKDRTRYAHPAPAIDWTKETWWA
jgi:7-cyano-7-deazaguanine synthase